MSYYVIFSPPEAAIHKRIIVECEGPDLLDTVSIGMSDHECREALLFLVRIRSENVQAAMDYACSARGN